MTDYEALRACGHSPFKAAQIVLDAKREDWFSLAWIKICRERSSGVDPGASKDASSSR